MHAFAFLGVVSATPSCAAALTLLLCLLLFTVDCALCTVQLGLTFDKKEHMGAIVWANVEEAKIAYGDAKELDFDTGFKEMLKVIVLLLSLVSFLPLDV